MHAPVIDSLLQEIGISGGSLQALTAALPQAQSVAPLAEPDAVVVQEEITEQKPESYAPSTEHSITTVSLS
jgi:hypothetical protein